MVQGQHIHSYLSFCSFKKYKCFCNNEIYVFFGEKREAIGKILRQLCEWKKIEIHAAEICPDHVHMLVSIPPKVSVSSFMGYLKGRSRSSCRANKPNRSRRRAKYLMQSAGECGAPVLEQGEIWVLHEMVWDLRREFSLPEDSLE